jgi:phosphoribosylaminoimidazole-succinocarboxamide synthase
MTDEWINTISQRYIELYEKVTGQNFVPQTLSNATTEQLVTDSLKQLGAL